MSEFLELTPPEYHPREWRRYSPYVEALRRNWPRADLDALSKEEELTAQFGFLCYQEGWIRGFAIREAS